MTCRVMSIRENRRFSCLEKVLEDSFQGQPGSSGDPTRADYFFLPVFGIAVGAFVAFFAAFTGVLALAMIASFCVLGTS
jgi:hypothetical protein